MKTAEEWRLEFDHMKNKPVHPAFFKQGVIEMIQKDAYEQGRNDQMAWVSKECLRLTEYLASNRDQDAKPLFYPPT